MSWLERIKEDLIIKCGDGKEYRPGWINAAKGKDYNVAEFDFEGVAGTYVHRKLPKGRKHALDLYFQGADHIEQAAAFESSADHPGRWEISHPYYGVIYVQPTAIAINNSELNISSVAVSVIETISLDDEEMTTEPMDAEVEDVAEEGLEIALESVATEPIVPAADIAVIRKDALTRYKTIAKKMRDYSDAEKYLNRLTDLNVKLNSATSTTLDIMQSLQSFSTFPYAALDAVADRLEMFETQYQIMKDLYLHLGRRMSYKSFELGASSTIFAMAMTAVQYVDEWAQEAADMIGMLVDLLNDFVVTIGGISSDIGSDPNGYMPNANTFKALTDAVNKAVLYLLDVTTNGKVEKTLFLQEDTDVFTLTHQLYGQDPDGEYLEKLIKINNISIYDLFGMKKDKAITYTA